MLFLPMVWKFPSVPDGKNKEKYQCNPIPTILDTIIVIMNLEKSHLSVRDSHFLQLISSYEILLKVYRSRFSLNVIDCAIEELIGYLCFFQLIL